MWQFNRRSIGEQPGRVDKKKKTTTQQHKDDVKVMREHTGVPVWCRECITALLVIWKPPRLVQTLENRVYKSIDGCLQGAGSARRRLRQTKPRAETERNTSRALYVDFLPSSRGIAASDPDVWLAACRMSHWFKHSWYSPSGTSPSAPHFIAH